MNNFHNETELNYLKDVKMENILKKSVSTNTPFELCKLRETFEKERSISENSESSSETSFNDFEMISDKSSETSINVREDVSGIQPSVHKPISLCNFILNWFVTTFAIESILTFFRWNIWVVDDPTVLSVIGSLTISFIHTIPYMHSTFDLAFRKGVVHTLALCLTLKMIFTVFIWIFTLCDYVLESIIGYE